MSKREQTAVSHCVCLVVCVFVCMCSVVVSWLGVFVVPRQIPDQPWQDQANSLLPLQASGLDVLDNVNVVVGARGNTPVLLEAVARGTVDGCASAGDEEVGSDGHDPAMAMYTFMRAGERAREVRRREVRGREREQRTL
jgi:hypothetical protein